MSLAKLSATKFAEMFEHFGPAKMAVEVGVDERRIYSRRRQVEDQLGRKLIAPPRNTTPDKPPPVFHPPTIKFAIPNGVVLIGSDAHYWPGYITTAHMAFVEFCKRLKPKFVIMNGDVMDGATISRYPPINWDARPPLVSELEECQERLEEIRKASPKANHIWTLGNHDARYEMRLAEVAPDYVRVKGTRLKDHFPKWTPCYRVTLNESVEIKHRYRGGIHAARNNALHSGRTTITGHLHSMKVSPITDFNGTRWGVDSGMLAEPEGPQFAYAEENPKDWRSGFIVLTFRDGQLLQPEPVEVVSEGAVSFRGEVIEI